MKPKRILVTNDDGIHSPGLIAAVEAVYSLGEVVVAAPSIQKTGAGRGISGHHDEYFRKITLTAEGRDIQGYHMDCSPAVIVAHAFGVLFNDWLPDLVVSGINYGENIGLNISQSGTVGAALQGASHGIPSLAVSLQTEVANNFKYDHLDWVASKYFLRLFAKKALTQAWPVDVDVLKIDVPSCASRETPWETTMCSHQHYYYGRLDRLSETTPIGEVELYKESRKEGLEENSDIFCLIHKKHVSVTPVSLNMTSRVDLGSLYRFMK